MDKEIFLKRLSIIKLLYSHGTYQSSQPDTVSFFSILSFHDSIEMFLKLLALKNNINSTNFKFLDYWDKIPNLTMKEAARALNTRRVNLKHKGLIPGKLEVEASRVTATEFFAENTIIHFDIDFSEISLIDLVENTTTKELLFEAEHFIGNNEIGKSVENTKKAFLKLIDSYINTKGNFWGRTPLNFIEEVEFKVPHGEEKSPAEYQLERLFKDVNKNFQNIEKTMSIIALGIDYKKYMKFEALTPYGLKTCDDNYIFEQPEDRKWTPENCEFCISFVVECAMKLQEFDYKYDTVYKSYD